MKRLIFALATSLIAIFPVLAQGESTPGRDLAETVFGSIEKNPDGLVDLGEFMTFGKSIFVSMDSDDNRKISFEEFTSWNFGFDHIAGEKGREQAFQTAEIILFALWDRNGNGEIGLGEYHKSMSSDFRRADTDGNAFLTKDEFLKNYIVNRAYRAALTGRR